MMEVSKMNEEGINSLRPLIETPEQIEYPETSEGFNEYKEKFVAINWLDNEHSEHFANICYIDKKGNYHELGSSKVLLEILQDYFRYIGNIDGPNGENAISFDSDNM